MSRDRHTSTLPFDPRTPPAPRGAPLPFEGRESEAAIASVARAQLPARDGAAAVPIALETLPWRHDGALRLTVIVKASFTMSGAEMAPADRADPIRSHDLHHKHQPMAHVVAAGDRAPWKMLADVTALGHARAPAGQKVPEMRVRFALLTGGQPLIDKTLHIIGDRAEAGDAPKPFTAMPLRYERAHGGAQVIANPIGCSGEDGELPNILDPHNAWRPAGLGPLSAAWPLRRRRLRDIPPKALDAPIIDLPREVDWAYFQSAPADQQITELPEDATLLLEGFDADRPRIEIALPRAQAAGAVYGLDEAAPDAPSPLFFRVDTVHIDADRWVCTLVYRACIDMSGRTAASLGRLLVAAAVGPADALPSIPETRPQASAGATTAAPRPAQPSATGTLELHHSAAGAAAILPFHTGADSPSQSSDAVTTLALPPSMPVAPPPEPPSMPVAPPPEPERLGPIPEEPRRPLRPEEEVGLERLAEVCAALDEPGGRRKRAELLAARGIEADTWQKAEQHWKRELSGEVRRAERALRERFDEAYIRAWEALHPGEFGPAEAARLLHGAKKGLLAAEMTALGLSPALGIRLHRVWKRRAAQDSLTRRAIEAALAPGDRA